MVTRVLLQSDTVEASSLHGNSSTVLCENCLVNNDGSTWRQQHRASSSSKRTNLAPIIKQLENCQTLTQGWMGVPMSQRQAHARRLQQSTKAQDTSGYQNVQLNLRYDPWGCVDIIQYRFMLPQRQSQCYVSLRKICNNIIIDTYYYTPVSLL